MPRRDRLLTNNLKYLNSIDRHSYQFTVLSRPETIHKIEALKPGTNLEPS